MLKKLRALFTGNTHAAHNAAGIPGAHPEIEDGHSNSADITNENSIPRTWQPPGWDLWYVFAEGPKYYDYEINENGKLIKFDHQEADYSTDVLRDRSVQFIRFAIRWPTDRASPFL